MGQSGGSLREGHVARRTGQVADGVRLHLLSDKVFHADPTFLSGCQLAGELIRSARLEPPPRRVFFLAHVAYELALDAVLLESEPDLAGDLYVKLSAGKESALAFLGERAPETLSDHFDVFIEHGYLRRYTRNATLAHALQRVAGRVGPELLSESDDADKALAEVFAQLRVQIAPDVPELLQRVGAPWYNLLT